MRKKHVLSVIIVLVATVSVLNAQIARQTGTIRGNVIDMEGVPLPGVSVLATGPALIGSISDITDANGNFRLAALPPGTYQVATSIDGFQTAVRDNIEVRTGMTLSVKFTLSQTNIEEEVTVSAPSPAVDVLSTKIATVMNKEVLQKLPLSRTIDDVLSVAPGVVGKIGYQSGTVHGVDAWNHVFELDGINTNSPSHNSQLVFVHYDAIEEVEISTGGQPAYVGSGGGSYFNVVTKSGGNEFHGQAQAYYTQEALAQTLFPDEQLSAMGIGKPSFPLYNWDASASLGGPLIKDKLWFFTDLGFIDMKEYGRFIPTTILGTRYEPFDLPQNKWQGMLKLTSQISDKLRGFVMLHSEVENKDIYNWWATRATKDATYTLDNNYRLASAANISWTPNSDTIVDFRAAIARRYFPITHREGTNGPPSLYDGYTGYRWNAPNNWASAITRQSRQASVRVTRFQDNFLGGDHELSAGIEWQWGEDDWGWWRKTPLDIDYYAGNIYYYRELYGLNEPHPVYGDGRIGGSYCGPNQGDSQVNGSEHRYGGYLQDSWTIKNRLTINLGVRFDSYDGYLPPAVKQPTEGVLREIGDYVLTPQFGFNPYDTLNFDGIDDAMGWTSISPRFGATYDLFGDGKTALKVSLSQYAEAMPVMFFSGNLHPHNPANFGFYWWDLNNNQQVDSPGVDDYAYRSGNAKFMDVAFNRLSINPDVVAPKFNEFTLSINHELFRDFKVGIQYLNKTRKDMLGSVLFDPESERYWYTQEKAPDWWIPFTTVVPGIGEFEDQQVTAYFMSKDAPYNDQFTQFTNVPEAERKYQAFELTFDKRYSDGWSLGGSLTISEDKGIEPGSNANEWVNGYGLTAEDIPLAIKVYGALDLPLGFVTSFYFSHFEGTPYSRSVTIYPTEEWAAANNAVPWATTVMVEDRGSRRNQSSDNLDFRLEKEFRLPIGTFGMVVDVFNLIGNRYYYVGLNPGGNWRPAGENTTAGGVYSPSGNYGQASGIEGTRIFKFSLRFTF